MSEKKTVEQKTSSQKKNTYEIDLIKVFWELLSHWLIIVCCMIIGGAAAFAYSHYFVEERYAADASILVVDTRTTISIYDLQFGIEMAEDYKKVLTGRETLNAVIQSLGLNMSYKSLQGIISVSMDEDSHVITIKAVTNNAALSVDIVNSLANIGRERISDVISGSEVTIMELATLDSVSNVTPNRLKYIYIGLLAGAILPCVIFLVLMIFDNTLSDEEEIINKLKLPVIADIPYYGKKNIMTEKLSFYEREAFNTLCGNIELAGYGIKSVAITSATSNEGKSSIAYKVAEIFTEFGKRVCFVDGDMRNSCFCEHFGIDKSKIFGLSEYLSQNLQLKQVVYATSNTNLSIITAGKVPPNPSALLSSDRFKEMIAQLSESFDYVFMDTPPISMVIDGVFVAKECDGCLMIVEEGVTETRTAVKTKDALLDAEANVIGVVVNKINRKSKASGYGKYGRYGRYGKHYGKYGKGYGYGHAPEENGKMIQNDEK